MNSIIYNNKLTVIIVSFHSNQIIESLILNIPSSIKILIVENSLNYELKKNLEKKFKNVKVLIPEENLGNGGGINLGLSMVKTEFSLYLDVDITPEETMIDKLLLATKKIKDFSMLAAKEQNYIYSKDQYISYEQDADFHKMRFITGCVLLFNMRSLDKIGHFDENIFLYYEEHDLYYRSIKKGFDIYMIDNAKFVHQGTSSTDKTYNHEIFLNRNWHYCWSKFYFFKKNYGYFYGIKKTIPNFLRALKKYIFYSLMGKKQNSSLHKAELQGLMASYLLKKSTKRPDISL
jgi:GT2 family glycosyltransferase